MATRGKVTAGEDEEDDIQVKPAPPIVAKASSSAPSQPQPPAAVTVPKAPVVGKVVFGEEEEEDTAHPATKSLHDQPLETANPFVYNPDDKDILHTPEKISQPAQGQDTITRRAPKSDVERRLVQRNEALRKAVAQKISTVYQSTHKNLRNSSNSLNHSLTTLADAAQQLRQGNAELAQATSRFHDMNNNALSILADYRSPKAVA